MRYIITLLFIISLNLLKAQTPNWAQDVAPILYTHCTSCHSPGGIAPFSLMTYNDAYSNMNNIPYYVSSRQMPPWPPDPAYSHFASERLLTQNEITTLTNWVTAGGPQGDPNLAPPMPQYSNLQVITSPDFDNRIPNYTVTSATDIYRCFVLPTSFGVDKYITELEVIPGNRAIVHHVLVFQDASSTCITLDNNDPGPGYTNFGGVGSSTATLIGAWVPGMSALSMPSGMGIKLSANANLVLQVHYPTGSQGLSDSTRILLKFSDGSSSIRTVSIAPALNHGTGNGTNGGITNGPLFIPANTVKTFYSAFKIPAVDVTALNVGPHMHLIGKSVKSYAVTPSSDTIPLIKIDNWDFHWQGNYNFKNLIRIPANSFLYGEATYDNTINNPHNPSNPPLDVTKGEGTTNEMMLIYFSYLPYQSGDENIIQPDVYLGTENLNPGGIVQSLQLYDVYPNPSVDNATISWYLPYNSSVKIDILSIDGRIVKSYNQSSAQMNGFGLYQTNMGNLPPGEYLIRLSTTREVRLKKLIKL